MSEIEIEIDGKKYAAQPNEMIIQVADANDVYIPRFCYHKHLSIAANCRMCLVEVEKAPKPAPACATPVMPGMKVFTKSEKAIAAQKAVMEFLLINHPLDCPICDQGGECELQDLSMGYGASNSFYKEGKRAVADENLGPLIETEMTRCILCTRCVRFGNEVAGIPELGVTNRGGHAEISTYVHEAIHSDVSGNIIDLCPVGALTSKPFRFKARPWELKQYPSIAAHDCLGSNINIHMRNGVVMRIVPRENTTINQTWISDRDRFSYAGLYHEDRLKKPLVRVQGEWRETDWQTAVDVAIGKLQKTLSAHGVEQLGALATPNATLEELYLLQKIMRELGTSNIDHRLRQVDFRDQEHFAIFPGLAESFTEIENADAILLIGSNIQKEQPVLSLSVRKAALKGADVFAINMLDYDYRFKIAGKKVVAPQEFSSALAELAQSCGSDFSLNISEMFSQMATQLREKKNIKILVGASLQQHPEASVLRALVSSIAKALQAKVNYLTEGANTAGAWIAGCVPHRNVSGQTHPGLNAQAMLSEPRKAYLLLNVEPDCDVANPVLMEKALAAAETVIALSTFRNSVLEKHAHVIFPVAPFTETSGTFVNAAGQWQSFAGVAKAFEESRPAWKVLRVLGNWLKLPNFDYKSSENIRDEVKAAFAGNQSTATDSSEFLKNINFKNNKSKNSLSRIGELPLYASDALTRRSKPLQTTQVIIEKNVEAIRVHPEQLQALNCNDGEKVTVRQGDEELQLLIVGDHRVPKGAAVIASGLRAMDKLSELFGEIEIVK